MHIIPHQHVLAQRHLCHEGAHQPPPGAVGHAQFQNQARKVYSERVSLLYAFGASRSWRICTVTLLFYDYAIKHAKRSTQIQIQLAVQQQRA
jgi:hypothetical protein